MIGKVGLVVMFSKRTCVPAAAFALMVCAFEGWAADPADADAGSSNRVPEQISLRDGQIWKTLARDVVHDQKHVITFPVHLITKGTHWKPTLCIGTLAAGLVALDPYDTPYFSRTSSFHGFNRIASGTNTSAAMFLTPVALYAWSAREHDSYGKQTAFLAGEAIIDVQIITFGMKLINRRARPESIGPNGNYWDTWFDSDPLNGSFPSGHAMTAFALADVYTERYYHRHRWVPFVAYALAGAVAFSRLPTNAHFPSDVFVGAALGTVVTHYLVLHHRD